MKVTATKLRILGSLLLAIFASVIFFGVGGQQSVRAATSGGPQAIAGIGAWRIGSADLNLSESTQQLGRYSVVVINAYESSWVPIIKADSPNTKVLMYTTAPDINQTCDLASEELTCGSGISLYDVNTNDQSWILRDASGNPIVNAGYPYYYVGDIGSSTYRSKWISHVTTQAKTLGFDGVSIDGILGGFDGETGGVVPAKYPTDSAWRTAMAGFIDTVGPALKAQGLYVGAEVYEYDPGAGLSNNNGSVDALWWQRVAPDLNALFSEYFEQNPNNWSQMYSNTHLDWTDNWDGWLKLIDVAQNAGDDFFGLNYATSTGVDVRNMTYGKASFLLKWNGRPGGAYFWDYRDGQAHDVWDPNWTMDIGTPLAAMYAVGTGAFRRDYTAGTVIVNPMQTTQTFSLGATYTTPSGTAVTSITLGPTSAAILQSTTTTASAPSNSSPPAISGTPQVGSQLTAAPGTWNGSLTSYSYQWRRCDSLGANCTAISGATGSNYPLASADQGATIRVSVTASNSAGYATAISAQTSAVTAAPATTTTTTTTTTATTTTTSAPTQPTVVAPSNTGLPAISGAAQQGQTLTASAGTWSGNPTSYAYQWMSCGSSGANCVPIGGATGSSYSPGRVDIGSTLRVAVIASNTGGSASATSAPSSTVAKPGKHS